jgi:hypothetical protein
MRHAALLLSCRSSPIKLASPSALIRTLECVLLHVDPLDEELDDARLFGGKQLVPDGGELGEQDGNLPLGDPISPSRFATAQAGATSSGAASSFWR